MTRAGRPCFAGTAALALLAVSSLSFDPVLLWNASASVPVGLYVVTPPGQPEVGALVAVRPPAALARWLVTGGYLGRDTPLLKHLAARAGAKVCRHGTKIWIDGALVAEALDRDHLGRPLPVWHGCRRLGPREVFLLNPAAPRSLDGRYFGLLDATTIIGRATPLWTKAPVER